jgi:hypothetical protein
MQRGADTSGALGLGGRRVFRREGMQVGAMGEESMRCG